MFEYLSERREDLVDPPVIDGVPVGAVTASISWMNTDEDIGRLVNFVKSTEF